MKKLSKLSVAILIALGLVGCESGMAILDGATHARGSGHFEGPYTDTEIDLDVCKVPDDYTVEQAVAYCQPVD